MYQAVEPQTIRRLSDGALIPRDERNVDYQKFLLWVADGNSIAPADPVSVLNSLPDLNADQIRVQLRKMGLLETVESTVAAGPQEIQLRWQYAPRFRITHPDVQALATQAGITQEQLITLFTEGSKII